jgi:hypothetical protein
LFSLIEYSAERREQIVSKAILKLFNQTDLELSPSALINEVDHLPYSAINEILGYAKGKVIILFVTG